VFHFTHLYAASCTCISTAETGAIGLCGQIEEMLAKIKAAKKWGLGHRRAGGRHQAAVMLSMRLGARPAKRTSPNMFGAATCFFGIIAGGGGFEKHHPGVVWLVHHADLPLFGTSGGCQRCRHTQPAPESWREYLKAGGLRRPHLPFWLEDCRQGSLANDRRSEACEEVDY